MPIRLNPRSWLASVALSVLGYQLRAQVPAIEGVWEPPFNHDGREEPNFNAIHMALIPKPDPRPSRDLQGKVFVMTIAPLTRTGPTLLPYAIIDPSESPPSFLIQELALPWANQLSNPPTGAVVRGDLFCCHHIWTREGHLFLAGGNIFLPDNTKPGVRLHGCKLVFTWNPSQWSGPLQGWTQQPDLAQGRYYPTVHHGPQFAGEDGYFIAGGLEYWSDFEREPSRAPKFPDTYEVYRQDPDEPTRTRPELNTAENGRIYRGPVLQPYPEEAGSLFWYPHMFWLSDDRLAMAGMSTSGASGLHAPRSQDTLWSHAFGRTPMDYPPGTWRHYGSSVLAPIDLTNPQTQDRVLTIGGGLSPSAHPIEPKPTATDSAWFTDFKRPASWERIRPGMTTARQFTNAVILADGRVLVLGGDRVAPPDTPVLRNTTSEIIDPRDPSIRVVTPPMVPRGYHSTGVLLPDGRVLYGGGNDEPGAKRAFDYQVYRPGYLAGPRPTITDAPTSLAYGQSFAIRYRHQDEATRVERAALIRPGATTHHFDTEQRYLLLESESRSGSSLRVLAPPGPSLAPPGYYMLIVRTSARIPSVAAWVHLQ